MCLASNKDSKDILNTAKGLVAVAGLKGKVCILSISWSNVSREKTDILSLATLVDKQEDRQIGGLLPGGIKVPGLSGGEKRR